MPYGTFLYSLTCNFDGSDIFKAVQEMFSAVN